MAVSENTTDVKNASIDDAICGIHRPLWRAQTLCRMIAEYVGPSTDSEKEQDILNAVDTINELIEGAHENLNAAEELAVTQKQAVANG